jgi:phage FluMu gp28-like protein
MAGPPIPLYAYQSRWLRDNSRLKIAVKAGQIGYSFAAALRLVLLAHRYPNQTFIVLSAGERQSKLFMDKVARHCRAMELLTQALEGKFKRTDTIQLECRFPNGSVIYGLPANPDTARGYSGHVVLDEFAFHIDPRKIYSALYPRTTRGYTLEIISTPNGPDGVYYEIARDAGLTQEGPAKSQDWSAHRTDIFEAVKQGFKLYPAREERLTDYGRACVAEWIKAGFSKTAALGLWQVRAGCLDEEMWLQEYCCQFLRAGARWITSDLYDSCVSELARVGPPRWLPNTFDPKGREIRTPAYAGWDVARNIDLSVVSFGQPVGEILRVVGCLELEGTVPAQVREAAAHMTHVDRTAVDMTGMGIGFHDNLDEARPGTVEGVTFTQPTKELLAVGLKKIMEDRRIELPDDPRMRTSFGMPRRLVSATGAIRFEAARDEEAGHADYFWSVALMCSAASMVASYFLEWMKREVKARETPAAPVTVDEEAVELIV